MTPPVTPPEVRPVLTREAANPRRPTAGLQARRNTIGIQEAVGRIV